MAVTDRKGIGKDPILDPVYLKRDEISRLIHERGHEQVSEEQRKRSNIRRSTMHLINYVRRSRKQGKSSEKVDRPTYAKILSSKESCPTRLLKRNKNSAKIKTHRRTGVFT